MEKKALSLLSSMGFPRAEAKILVDLMQNPNSTPNQVAKRTHIHRSNVYDVLRRLKQKGIISETTKNNKTFYRSHKPERLRELAKQIERDVEEIIPALKMLQKETREDNQVSVSYGIHALRHVLLESLDNKEPICVLGAPKIAVAKLTSNFAREYHKKRSENNIPFRIIYSKKGIERVRQLNKYPHTEARCFADEQDSPTSISIAGDLVHIIVYKEPIVVIEIKDRDIANFYRDNFERMWSKSLKIT